MLDGEDGQQNDGNVHDDVDEDAAKEEFCVLDGAETAGGGVPVGLDGDTVENAEECLRMDVRTRKGNTSNTPPSPQLTRMMIHISAQPSRILMASFILADTPNTRQ